LTNEKAFRDHGFGVKFIMGLFDFALHTGNKWNDSEIRALDKNFNSISNYTSFKYDFDYKHIENDIKLDHAGYVHEIRYSHTNIEHKDQSLTFACNKYKIDNRDQLSRFINFYEMYSGDDENEWRNIKVPNILRFPSYLIQVGYHGLGFINILGHDNNGNLSSECEKLIRINSMKFLKNLGSDEKGVKFET
jgi:hypothetical protein